MLLSNNTYISEQEKYEEKLNLRKDQMLELYKDNNDIIGWIYIENSKIDYPLLQGTDNEYYINYNFKNEKSKLGRSYNVSENSIDVSNKIITLSTCSYETDDSRFVVHGVLENIIEN